MNRASIVLLCFLFTLLAACGGKAPPDAAALPDLQVVQAGVFLAERCAPYQPVLNVVALVRNVGTAASLERLDVGMVGASDAAGSGWGNGVGLPSLEPGAETKVRFPIYYLLDDPAHMAGAHTFAVTVNRGGWLTESNTDNNRYSPDPTVTIPAGACSSDEAPTLNITTPAADTGVNDSDFVYDGYDEAKKLWYKDVTLGGSATDPEDGDLTGSALVWATDRTDLQAAALGTGKTLGVRLYSDTCTGTRHEVKLTATDSGGNTQTALRRISIWTLC